ncbi:Replication factor C subunit 3 [Spathaspora sp. JA1]|nr:Replication factor C subunit 3 [Spathaspora sp. JA1]
MPSITSPSLSPNTTGDDSTQHQSHQERAHPQAPGIPSIVILEDSPRNTPLEQLKIPPHLNHTYSDSELITIDQLKKRRAATKLNRSNSESDADSSSEEEDDDLLGYLKQRQSDDYRFVKFLSEEEEQEDKFFKKSVSFDDINLQCDTDDEPDWNDDLGWDLFRLHNAKGSHVKGYSNNYYYSSNRGRDSLRSSSPASPLASPTRRASSPDMGSGTPGLFDTMDGVAIPNGFIQYPSQPITNHKCCSISRQHSLFEALYKYKLPFTPTLPRRTILVYISGRIHTWVALDWILTKFIENGDKIIVVSSVNADILERRRKRGRKGSTFTSPPKYHNSAPMMRMRQRTVPNNIMNIAQDIMDYCLTVIDKTIIAKVVVEIVAGRTKDVLKDIYKLYEPNLVCTGTKPNVKTGAPLKSWNSSKLTDRLVKNFPLPVIMVPAMNMGTFELELQQKMTTRKRKRRALSPNVKEESESESADNSSINSSYGTSGEEELESDENEVNSYDEISNLYVNYKHDVETELNQARAEQVSPTYYSNLIKIISDKSSSLCFNIVDISPDFRGNGSKLARVITGSNSFGVVPFKTKSLLDPIEDIAPKLSFKEVKERLKMNKVQEEQATKPKSTSLKFDEPKRERRSSKGLLKSKSHDVDSVRPKLEPRKSHPELKLSRELSHDKKKKRGFWKQIRLVMLLLLLFIQLTLSLQLDNDSFVDLNITNFDVDSNSSTGLEEFTPIIDTIIQSQVKYYSFNVNTSSGLGGFYELLIFITGNICTQPQGLPDHDPSLAVYYSFNSSMFSNNDLGKMSLFENGYMQALADLPISDVETTEGAQPPPTVLYIAVRAPENTNTTASWTYQIGVSQNDLVFQWDDRDWASVLDTDDTSAVIVTGNLTGIRSSRHKKMPYSLYVYSYNMKNYFSGMNNSWCAIHNGPALIGPSEIDMRFTNNSGDIKQQFVVNGLNASSKYIGYIVAESIGTSTGGAVFRPFQFETLENDACQLIYDLPFCERVSYSVPRPDNSPSVNYTRELYDNYTESLYENFTKVLQQIPCDAGPDSVFSNMKTCNDCAEAYKDWLCAVSIPRCSTKSNITGYKLREENCSRNSFINEVVKPKDYYEVLPCVNTCYAIVRDCPADLGFSCPLKEPMSYYIGESTGEGNEQWPSCNYVGKFGIIQSSDSVKLGLNWVVVLIEKYRPETLDDIYGQQEIVTTVHKFIQTGKLPHLLFYGPPGTGKTSTIIAIAREIYGTNYKNMVLELNASDDRGIDVVRNQIKNFASTRQIFNQGNSFKLIILDEADAMTNAAQNSLRRIIEKFTKNCRFCILANYAHKLNPALISRCTRFRFHPIDTEGIKSRIQTVITKEEVEIDTNAVDALIKLSKGDMRRALNVLQACKAAAGIDTVDSTMIFDCIGAPHPQDIETVLDSILKDDWTTSYLTINKFKSQKGLALIDLIAGFIEILATYQLNNKTRLEILKGLSDVEYGISKGGNEKIQTSAIIGIIKNAMENE